MRTASLCAAAVTLLAAPSAFATSSIHCRTRAGGPDIWISVGNGPGDGISQARIVFGREEIVTGATRDGAWISRSGVDRHALSLRIARGAARGTDLLLSASRRGRAYIGSVVWRGRSWPVRCFWDEDDPE